MDALDTVKAGAMIAEAVKRLSQKHDSPGSPSAVVFSHGPQGNLTFPGVDPTMFNAALGAPTLLSQLAPTPAMDTNPTYLTLTGVQAASGSEKDEACDNAPTAGLLKACMATSVFGRYERATPEIDLTRLGKVVDRADPMDLRLVGTPLSGPNSPFGPGASLDAPVDLLTNEISRKMWELAVAFHRLLSNQLWTGNPTNNSAGGGYRELTGLQALVATGYVDSETGVACAAVDSNVQNFNNVDVASAGTQIVAALTNLYYQAKDRATRMGLMPVRWVLGMKPQMFYELTSVWPCVYNTYRCLTAGNERLNLDSQRMVEMRDAMREGKYLLIDGDRVEVVVDDGIPETENAVGCFDTDIYLLPLSVVGGRSVLFLQYFDYANPSLRGALSNMVLARINGAFMTWPRQTNTCFVLQSVIEPRLVLRTPYLAGRLQNVRYCPIQHTRDADPTGDYFVNGGKTSRSGPSFYSVWQANA